MAAAVRYLKRRNGVFVYRRWIPEGLRKAVGSESFRRSLKTKDQSEALTRAAVAEREYDELIARAANDAGLSAPLFAKALVPIRMLRPVTQFDLDMIEADKRRSIVATLEPHVLRADTDPDHRAFLDAKVNELELFAVERRSAITEPGFDNGDAPHLPSPLNDARDLVASLSLDAPQGSDTFGAIVAALRRGYLAGYHDLDELLAGRLKPRLVRVQEPHATPPTAPLYSEAVAAYLDHRQLPAKTVREVERYKGEFIALVGDKRLDEMTRADFVAYVKLRASRMVGGKTDDSIVRPASHDTVAKALSFVRVPIEHAIQREDIDFAGPNPAASIRVQDYLQRVDETFMPAKRPFRVGELNKLFQHPWFTGCRNESMTHQPGAHRLAGAEYWVPIVALFTGCRVSELGGLRVSEVRLDDPHPHFLIRNNEVRRTKTLAATRCIPILDALIKHGFDRYVVRIKKSSADRLFPDWEPAIRQDGSGEQAWYNSKLIKAFNRTLVPAQLGDGMVTGARRDVTFHALRGAFKTMLGSARYQLHPNLINEVVGHAKSELDRRYVGIVPIEETYSAIRACTFEGLILPPPL